MIVVYQHRCLVTGKSYVGFTSRDIEKRWLEHVKDAKRGSPFHFHAAIRAHGVEAWEHHVLQECADTAEAKAAEREWIKRLDCVGKNGYNETGGGDGVINYTFTSEDRHKMRLAKLGRPGNARGSKRTDAWRMAHSGTSAVNARLSEAAVNDIITRWANRHEIPVNQRQLAAEHGVTQSTVSRLVNKITGYAPARDGAV